MSFILRLDEQQGSEWRPRLSSFQFQTLLHNLTDIKIRGTFGENGKYLFLYHSDYKIGYCVHQQILGVTSSPEYVVNKYFGTVINLVYFLNINFFYVIFLNKLSKMTVVHILITLPCLHLLSVTQ